MFAVDDEICRVRNGQDKTGGVGDESAGEEIRFWLNPGAANGGEHGRREHNGSGVCSETGAVTATPVSRTRRKRRDAELSA